MARIYPEKLDAAPTSERVVHRALSQLSDEYLVVHGARWIGRPSRGDRVRDGEADFVVAHPDLGVLVLEVKGGRISLDSATGSWESLDRQGDSHRISDPFAQAMVSKHLLINKLREHVGWPRRRVSFGHGVCFPDVQVEGSLKPDAPRELILDASDLDDIEGGLRRLFRFFDDDGPPGERGVGTVASLLAPTFTLRRSLGDQIRSEKRELIRLTEQQVQAFDLLRGHRRAIVQGCAGSGKTVLATEKARQLSDEGLRVLLLCYNKRLARRLAADVEDCVNVTANNFHSLAMATIKRAELELDWDVDAQELWDRQVPERLVDAIVATEERYDAVVVDEGQDFAASWWSPIQWLLEDEEDGIVYIFMDNNQRLYDRSRELPIDSEPFSLTLNCRNTRHIHDFVKSFFSGESVPQVDGPVGRPVEIIRCRDSSDLGPAVLAKFQRLFGREKVDLGDVIVLTGHGARRSQLNGLQGEGFRIEVGPRKKKCVELESIYGFKGLERPIVALADLEDLDEDRIDRLMYVGASRAQSHLLVFAPEGLVLPAM